MSERRGWGRKRIVLATAAIAITIALLRVPAPIYRFTDPFPWIPTRDPVLPDVLLIGDSTAMRYYRTVREALTGIANVWALYEYDRQRLHSLVIGGPLIRPVNAASTARGVADLDAWLGGRDWDVIHFNWGIHDLVQSRTDVDPEVSLRKGTTRYVSRLDTLAARLEDSGAVLIFATTTPVPADDGAVDGAVESYNAAAVEIMERRGIAVNDLYGLVEPRQEELQFESDVHFRPEGSRLLGRQVAESIREALAARGGPSAR